MVIGKTQGPDGATSVRLARCNFQRQMQLFFVKQQFTFHLLKS